MLTTKTALILALGTPLLLEPTGFSSVSPPPAPTSRGTPLLALSFPGAGVRCGNCSYSPTPAGEGYHHFWGGEEDLEASEFVASGPSSRVDEEQSQWSLSQVTRSPGWLDEGSFDCESWNSCHSNYQIGACSGWHDPCGSGGSSLVEALAAARSGSPATLLDVARAHQGTVRLLGARGVIQVLDCRGSVIAQEEFVSQPQVRRVGAD